MESNTAILVKDCWGKQVGVLAYDSLVGNFHFCYDEDHEGFKYSDININKSREFSQGVIFNLFSFDDSWNRQMLIEKYGIESLSENEIQWFLICLWADKQEATAKGYYFEKI